MKKLITNLNSYYLDFSALSLMVNSKRLVYQSFNTNRLILVIALLLVTCINSMPAAPLKYVPQTITQPNGESIECFASGDEFNNWLHDAAGYTIIQSQQDGYYYYAEPSGDSLIPSKYRINKKLPLKLDVKPWLKVSYSKFQDKVQSRAQNKKLRHISNSKSDAIQTATNGIINNVVVFIRFAGEAEFTDSTALYDNMFNPAEGNSMKHYFQEVSYNQLTVNTTQYPLSQTPFVVSYQATQARNYFRPYNGFTNDIGYRGSDQARDREFSLLTNAINAIAAQIPAELNIDNDDDGYVDNVCFIVCGAADGWSDLLWPHYWTIYDREVMLNGKRVYDYNLQIRNSLLNSGVGVLCHEMFHTLGAPDLYHYYDNGIQPVGAWDLMEMNANPPQHMGAYMKYKYGKWINTIPQITNSGTYTLNPLTSNTNNCYKIPSPYSISEYFILEYRKDEGTFEASLPGSGLLIYRINAMFNGNADGPPDEVYLYRPNGTRNANGIVDNANFSSDVGRTSINSTTNPTPFLSNGSQSGLKISQISAIGNTISFHVELTPMPSLSSPTNAEIHIPTHTVFKWAALNNFTHYRLQVSTSFDFSDNVLDIIKTNTSHTCSTALSEGTTYYWRVRALSDTDTSNWSNSWTFTTELEKEVGKTFWSTGYNFNGQLGDGTIVSKTEYNSVGIEKNWSMIVCANMNSVAIKTDGTLWAWGNNFYGQLGDGTDIDRSIPIQIGYDADWSQVAAGEDFCVAIKTDGTLWAWGNNFYYQLGDGTVIDKNIPTQIGNDNNWSKLACGLAHTLAIKTDGTLWAWGNNRYGQLGDGTETSKNTPVQIGTATNWATISCGEHYSTAIKTDGTLWAWGNNRYGQLGDGTEIERIIPTQIGNQNNWSKVSAGTSHTIAIKTDGTLWAWGSNEDYQLGDSTSIDRLTPIQVGTAANWIKIASGYAHNLALKSDGTLWAWGANYANQLGDGTGINRMIPTQVSNANDWTDIECGEFHSAFIKNDNTLLMCGSNDLYQLGDGTIIDKSVPTLIGNGTDWTDVSCGTYHTVALKNNGTLWACGVNYDGRLGLGNTLPSNVFSQIGVDTNWSNVYCGAIYTLAKKKDGTLWGWGRNTDYQLGNGTATNSLVPIQIGNSSNWAMAAGGSYHSLAIKTDGTLWGWGINTDYQLADVNTNSKTTPTQIGTANDWAYVSAGVYHTVALKTNGTLWAWGGNDSGQLGDGTTNPRSTPTQIGLDSNWAIISAAHYHTLAIKKDSTLWAWGSNYQGALGDGTTINRFIPTQIGTATNWVSIEGSDFNTYAIKSDGTLWACGYNEYGELGNGTDQTPLSLIQIGTAKSWAKVAGGGYHTVALQYTGIAPTNTPTLIAPSNNSTIPLTNTNLLWNAADYASAYNIQVSNAADFNMLIINKTVNTTNYQLNGLADDTQYFWRVRAQNSTNTSEWSTVWSFTTANPELIPVPASWAVTTNTGNFANVGFQTQGNFTIGNRTIERGDAVGVFYTRGEQKVCAGYLVWGDQMGMTIWGDNDQTQLKDGFAVGETYTLKVWDGKTGSEYPADYTVLSGNNYYSVNGVSVLSLVHGITHVTQTIPLASGWNLISGYVMPNTTAIQDLVFPISSQLTIMKNANGLVHWPGYITSLTTWDKYQAYFMNVTAATELSLTGQQIKPEQTPIQFANAGWYWMPYFRTSAANTETALSSIGNNFSIVKAANGDTYWPGYMNTLSQLEPHKGYMIYMTAPANLTYSANSEQANGKINPSAVQSTPMNLMPDYSNTGNSATLAIEIDGANSGDEFGVYTADGLLVGSAVYSGKATGVNIWGDNDLTAAKDGAIENETLIVKLFNSESNSLSAIAINSVSNALNGEKALTLQYNQNAVTLAKGNIAAASAEDFNSEFSISPQPVRNEAIVTYNVENANAGISSGISIELYDLKGTIVATYNFTSLSEGTNKLRLDVSNIPSGMYNAVIKNGAEVHNAKLIKVD